jgi:hypothetical protein
VNTAEVENEEPIFPEKLMISMAINYVPSSITQSPVRYNYLPEYKLNTDEDKKRVA